LTAIISIWRSAPSRRDLADLFETLVCAACVSCFSLRYSGMGVPRNLRPPSQFRFGSLAFIFRVALCQESSQRFPRVFRPGHFDNSSRLSLQLVLKTRGVGLVHQLSDLTIGPRRSGRPFARNGFCLLEYGFPRN